VWRVAALAALISFVVVPGVEGGAVSAVSHPKDALREFKMPGLLEGVRISHNSPNIYSSRISGFEFGNFEVRIQSWKRRIQDEVVSWSKHPCTGGRMSFWQGEREIIGQWKWEHVSGNPESYVVRRGEPTASKLHSWLKSIHGGIILRHGPKIPDAQVRARLQFADEFLPIRDPFGGLVGFNEQVDVGGHGSGNALHGGSNTRPLGDRGFHVIRLASRDLVHLRDGGLEPPRLDPENEGLNEPNNRDSERKFDHPPIGARFVISLVLILGGFFCGLRGGENAHHQGRIVSAALIGTGLILSAMGYWLWLSI
jgi:hypothetical protein